MLKKIIDGCDVRKTEIILKSLVGKKVVIVVDGSVSTMPVILHTLFTERRYFFVSSDESPFTFRYTFTVHFVEKVSIENDGSFPTIYLSAYLD